ncbi:MAG: hypothetical protein LBS37_06580 [Treponema sp.]|nr:hypothetical protein [Treponema sp.]
MFFILTGPLFFFACAGQKKIIFHPEFNPLPEQAETLVPGEIIESRNGPADAALPEWLGNFLNGGIRRVEAQGVYWDKYIFIGKNSGTNLNALRQWAERFTVAQDLPRLVGARIENRLLAAADLYPDDEYGEFFEAMIKSASDAEYPEALKEDNFWIKWRISGEPAADLTGEGETENTVERDIYEFFVLISIDKIALQNRIQALMANIQTAVSPTRDQAASINRIRQNFFEVF